MKKLYRVTFDTNEKLGSNVSIINLKDYNEIRNYFKGWNDRINSIEEVTSIFIPLEEVFKSQ